MKNKTDHAGRIIAFLTREQIDFLDKLAKDALFTKGHKLSRTEIISAIINAVSKFPIDGKDVKNASDLENKIIKLLSRESHDIINLINNLNSDYKHTDSTEEITDKIIKKIQKHSSG